MTSRDLDPSVIETLNLMERHSKTWRDKPEWYWFLGLLEEVIELGGALIGLHKGPMDWELSQIAAICMNWRDMRASKDGV